MRSLYYYYYFFCAEEKWLVDPLVTVEICSELKVFKGPSSQKLLRSKGAH